MQPYDNLWAEVDLGAIAYNTRAVKHIIGKNVRLLAVVKNNGYGHGIVQVSETVLKYGADYLGVSTIKEGINLREHGIEASILIFTPFLPDEASFVIKYRLIPAICYLDQAKALDEMAQKYGTRAAVHIKIDTGFGRFGVLPEHAPEFASVVQKKFEGLLIEGVYSHFSTAYTGQAYYCKKQFATFVSTVKNMENKLGRKIALKHIANSAATLKFPETRLDMVRIGNLLYGVVPCNDPTYDWFKNPWKVKSRLVSVKNVPAGFSIGYGAEVKTRKNSVLGVIPVGFAHGFGIEPGQNTMSFTRLIKNFIENLLKMFGFCKTFIKINRQKCPIIGRISMQHTIIDLTNLKGVEVGDEVEVDIRRTTANALLPKVYIQDETPAVNTEARSKPFIETGVD